MTFQSKPIMGAKPSSGGDFAGVEIELCFKDNLAGNEVRIGPKEIPLGKMYRFSSEYVDDHIDDRIDPSTIDNLAFAPKETDEEDAPQENEPEISIFHGDKPFKVWPVGQTDDGKNPTVKFSVNREEDGILIVECKSILYNS